MKWENFYRRDQDLYILPIIFWTRENRDDSENNARDVTFARRSRYQVNSIKNLLPRRRQPRTRQVRTNSSLAVLPKKTDDTNGQPSTVDRFCLELMLDPDGQVLRAIGDAAEKR